MQCQQRRCTSRLAVSSPTNGSLLRTQVDTTVNSYLDLRPLRIGRESDEEIGCANPSNHAHGILVHVLEVCRAAYDLRAQRRSDANSAATFTGDTIESLDEVVPARHILASHIRETSQHCHSRLGPHQLSVVLLLVPQTLTEQSDHVIHDVVLRDARYTPDRVKGVLKRTIIPIKLIQ